MAGICECLLLLGKLLGKGLLLVLQSSHLTLFAGELGGSAFDTGSKLAALLIELVNLLFKLSL